MFHVAKTDKIYVSNKNINFNCLEQYNPIFYNYRDSLQTFTATLKVVLLMQFGQVLHFTSNPVKLPNDSHKSNQNM